MDSIKLEEVVKQQKDNFLSKEKGINRDINLEIYIQTEQIIIISGIRRSGKSTLLRQIASKLDNFFYINFDDERLIDFTVSDFENLMIIWHKEYKSKNILIDEIQNIDGWERFARRLKDDGYKLFITGSNAKLLSNELATRLTGRYNKIEVYPFSFREFLRFHNLENSKKYSINKAELIKKFDIYMTQGGFPQYIKSKNIEDLTILYNDIIYKDIIARFNIKEQKTFREISSLLLNNFTKEMSYNSLQKIFDISPISIKNYILFLEESYILFQLFKFDHSLKKQYVSNKKIYTIDNGLRNIVSFTNSEDKGKLLENIVFLELKRKYSELYYHKNKKECDFIIRNGKEITEVIQVCFDTSDQKTKQREINGLLEAMEFYGLQEGFILTYNQKEKININNKNIIIIPVWEWLMS